MKKILSLLSVLTISGTAVPTTIAASPYQKEEQLNNINTYQQINYLENLNRTKRQPDEERRSREIFQLTEKIIINKNRPREYKNSSVSILRALERLGILVPVINFGEENEDSIIYTLNSENYGYIRIPVSIINENVTNNLELVLRTDNLYLQGFIITQRSTHTVEQSTYYHFNFTRTNQHRQPWAVRNNLVPNLVEINGIESRTLNNIGPDYRDILPREENIINWNNIYDSFFYLTDNININENSLGNLARSLGRVIFTTSESLRFRNIYNIISNDIINNNRTIYLNFRDDQIYQILVSWGNESRQYRSLLFNERGQYQGFEASYGIDLFLHSINSNSEFNFFDSLISIDIITEYLRNSNVRILLGRSFPLFAGILASNCNWISKKSTKFESIFWKKQFCDLKPQIDNIEGKISTIKILDGNLSFGKLPAGDIYVGTDKGLYLIHNNKVIKVEHIDSKVTNIIIQENGDTYVTTDKEEVYFILVTGNAIDLNNKFLISSYIISKNISLFEKIRNNNLSWVRIKKENPVYNKNNDVFEVDYQFLSPDKIKLKITLPTALAIEKMFYENKEEGFREYLNELLKKMPQIDNTGAGGSITDDDHKTMENFIFNNYAYFHNAIANLENDKTKNVIWVSITRSTTGLDRNAIWLKYFDNIKLKSATTLQNNPKLDISSMAKLSDTVSSSGKSILKFKIPSELHSNLLTTISTQITQDERNNINKNVDQYIKLKIKEKIHEKILEINNSLTENDYDITFKYPNNTTHFNPLLTKIIMDFIITGKNNAIGKIEQEIIIDAKN